MNQDKKQDTNQDKERKEKARKMAGILFEMWLEELEHPKSFELRKSLNFILAILTSFPRKRESSICAEILDSRLRGNDTWVSFVIQSCSGVISNQMFKEIIAEMREWVKLLEWNIGGSRICAPA